MIKVLASALAVGAAVAIMLSVGQASGREAASRLYVSGTGSDSGSCSKSQPCRSFDRAYTVASRGQVVEVAAGTYPDQDFRARAKGGGSGVVLFRPAPGASVILGSVDMRGQNHIELRDMKVRDWYIRYAQDVTFRNVSTRFFFVRVSKAIRILGGSVGPSQDGTSPTIGNYTGEPVSSNVTIDGVLFHDIGRQDAPGAHVECLFLQESSGVVIRNSRFTRCDIIDLYVSPVQGGPTASNVLVENNWFDEPTDGGYYAIDIHPDNGTVPQNFRLSYNSINSSILIYDNFAYKNVDLVGNIGRISSCDLQGVSFSHNVWSNQRCGSTDRRAPAGFVDAGSFDLHLRPGSAAIKAGAPNAGPARDIEGDRRPTLVSTDAGADQRESAGLAFSGAIGEARIGMSASQVAAFYGAGRAGSRRYAGQTLKTVTYKAHGGRLWIVYAGDVAVGMGTTSRYYQTSAGLGVGNKARSLLRGATRLACHKAYRRGAGPLELRFKARRGMLTSIELVKRRYSGC